MLCIHSKKHIKNPPEKIAEKQAQNLESMKALGSLTSQGGSVFWVAPRWVSVDLDIGEFDLLVHGDYVVVVFIAAAETVQTRAVPSWSLPST